MSSTEFRNTGEGVAWGSWSDISAEAGSHDVFVPAVKLSMKLSISTKVVGTVRVPHQNISS